MKTNNISIEKNIVLILLAASGFTCMGGLMYAIISEMLVGWDGQAYGAGLIAMLAGFVALMVTALLDCMVDSRERSAHEILMDELRGKNAKPRDIDAEMDLVIARAQWSKKHPTLAPSAQNGYPG